MPTALLQRLRLLYNAFDIIWGQFARTSPQLHRTLYAPCAMLYFVPVLIWCWLVLGIRRCDRFGASGKLCVGSPDDRFCSCGDDGGRWQHEITDLDADNLRKCGSGRCGVPLCCNCAAVEGWLEQGCRPGPQPVPVIQAMSHAQPPARCSDAPKFKWRHNPDEWALALALVWRRQQQANEAKYAAKTPWQWIRQRSSGLVELVAEPAQGFEVVRVFEFVLWGMVGLVYLIPAIWCTVDAVELARWHQEHLDLMSGR